MADMDEYTEKADTHLLPSTRYAPPFLKGLATDARAVRFPTVYTPLQRLWRMAHLGGAGGWQTYLCNYLTFFIL